MQNRSRRLLSVVNPKGKSVFNCLTCQFPMSQLVVLKCNNEVNFQNVQEENCVVREKKCKITTKHSEEVHKFFYSKKCLAEIKPRIPVHLMTKKNSHPSLHIVDKEIASNLHRILTPHLKSSKSHILEVNAGFGVLTHFLMRAGHPRLHIYEENTALHNELQVAIQNQKSDAKLFKANLLKLWVMMRQDRNDSKNRVSEIFDGLPRLSWEDEPVVKIIAALPNECFLAHMLYSVVLQNGICEFGRPELFVLIQPSNFNKMTAGPDRGNFTYMSKAVLFQLLFEYSVLMTIPGTAVVPWITNKKNKPNSNEGIEDYWVVKITARQDLFKKIPPDQIKPVWFFVKMLLQKRSAKLIPTMEKWLPGFGVKLISHGHTIFTECGSLSPDQILQFCKDFIQLPEYEATSFHSAMENLLLKMSDPGMTEMVEKNLNKFIKIDDEAADVDTEEIMGNVSKRETTDNIVE